MNIECSKVVETSVLALVRRGLANRVFPFGSDNLLDSSQPSWKRRIPQSWRIRLEDSRTDKSRAVPGKQRRARSCLPLEERRRRSHLLASFVRQSEQSDGPGKQQIDSSRYFIYSRDESRKVNLSFTILICENGFNKMKIRYIIIIKYWSSKWHSFFHK